MDTERLKFLAGYAIDNISEVRIRRQDMEILGIDNPPMVVGIQFNCPNGQRKEFIQRWAEDAREDMTRFDLDLDPILLTVSLGCGEATYRTADDVPLIDVPCPCGDPNHWLVKWSTWPAEILGGQQ